MEPERKRLCVSPPAEPTWELPAFDAFQLPPLASTLRIVTWNVWFDPQHANERMALLFAEALRAAPDVICLQEVVEELATSIRQHSALGDAYSISANEIGAYGCLMLVRHSLSASFREIEFECSNMGRSLLIAELAPSLAVATTHLESLNSPRARAKQLRIARDALAPYERAILCGDFNFDSTQNFGDWRKIPPRPPRPTREDDDSDEEEYKGPIRQDAASMLENRVLAEVLGDDYVDCWPALRPGEPGHTFDGASNRHVRDAHECMRYDRVMARGMQPLEISMLGVAKEQQPDALLPSDHYGLCAVVERVRSGGSEGGGGAVR